MNGKVEIWKCLKEGKSEWQVWMICALPQSWHTHLQLFRTPGQKNKGQPAQGAVYTGARPENTLRHWEKEIKDSKS